MSPAFTTGMTVRARGERFVVLNVENLPASLRTPLVRLKLRSLDPHRRGDELPVIHPIEPVLADEVPELSLSHPGRLARFRLLHDVFRLNLSPPHNALVSAGRARIRFEPYQFVPALRALELPRPRLLLADDVGLGKTIEAGLILRELNARRRANRVLIVCPAGIMTQWKEELRRKLGLEFKIFDRDGLHEARVRGDIGSNPWAVEPRVIASMDFIKRREGPFRELSTSRWDVVVVDEAHHLAAGRAEEDITDRHRLAQWLSDAADALLLLTATPHDGYDESLASLLGLLEPSLVLPGQELRRSRYQSHIVRRLKRHIKNEDGTDKFPPRSVEPIPVLLTPAERALHEAVLAQVHELEQIAEKVRRKPDAEAIRLVATVLRKRAASCRYALAQTIRQRQENLREKAEEIELQREHLRALRRGEALPDEDLARLERDAHRNYLSVVRRLGAKLRSAEKEQEALEHLQALLELCLAQEDSKISRLLETLRAIHAACPDDKVIIFSEYSDTVQSVAKALEESPEFRGRHCTLTGDLPAKDRDKVIAEFARPGNLLLVATDAAGEGLNLHHHCHRMVHLELPWNPNRLEQRNGRIDRYGQQHSPRIAFLYAQDTYEGEVLARLVTKIEKQISKLGSVGDVLGQIQAQRIEEILSQRPADLNQAIAEAERRIDQELQAVGADKLPSLLGDGALNPQEVEKARQAASRGIREGVELADFLHRAINAAGGKSELGETLRVLSTPESWRFGPVEARYDRLVPPNQANLDEIPAETLLDEDHPLVQAALRWYRASRFRREGDHDHRLAYTCSPEIAEPDLVATFLILLRVADGEQLERLETVRVARDLRPSQDRDADLAALDTPANRNVPNEILIQLFQSWWQPARSKAHEEALRRASSWRQALLSVRGLSQTRIQQDFRQWERATRSAILGAYAREFEQARLFGQVELPPAVRRKLRQHEDRCRERGRSLEQRMKFDEPSVEPLGVLLRVPASALKG